MATPALASPQDSAPTILRLKDLAQRYGCDVRTIFRYHVEGVIPKGRYLPKKCWPFWYLNEILANESKSRRLKRRREIVTAPKQTYCPLQFQLPLK